MENQISHRGKILDAVEDFEVIECELCNFRHLNPIPTDSQLEEFYRIKYYNSHKADYIQQDLRDIKFLEISYEDRLSTFEKFAPGKKILDVGCGAGMFMKYAQSKSWDCTGIEPSKIAWEQAKSYGLKVYHTTFLDYTKENTEKFDIVHLKNVLEHVPNPIEVLKVCRKILRNNGILYLEVPNDYDLSQRIGVMILKEKKSWLAIPDHINYFNFKSLKKLLVHNGFKIVKRDTTFPIYLLLLFGLNFIRNKHQGTKAHNIRMNFELFLKKHHLNFLKRYIYSIISYLGLGRTVIFYSRIT